MLTSANEELGHRSLHYQGESGVYVIADLVYRIQTNTATWDSFNMLILKDHASQLCSNLVSLDANKEDKKCGIDFIVVYDDVLQSLETATTSSVYFRNRFQSYDKLKNMLFVLVSRGILYFRNVSIE